MLACREHGDGCSQVSNAAAEFSQLRECLFENGIVVGHTPTLCLVSADWKFSVSERPPTLGSFGGEGDRILDDAQMAVGLWVIAECLADQRIELFWIEASGV